MASTDKVFSLENKYLRLNTAEDVEPHIAPLREMVDVEEVRLLGNTYGVGACKLLGEVLSTKKTLQVCFSFAGVLRQRSGQNLGCEAKGPSRKLTSPTSSLAV